MINANEKNVVIKKPNQTITITNKNISATQRKAYNVLLHKAQQDLMRDPKQTNFTIPIAEVQDKAGIQRTNNKRVREELEALMDIKVKSIRDDKNWNAFVLLSHVGRAGDQLEFDFPSPIKESLIKNNYYTPLDLAIISGLEGKYAIIFYETAIRYEKKQIPELSIGELKDLTGTQKYKDFTHIKDRCIDPGINEVNKKTDVMMDYNLTHTGRKVTSIKFSVKRKPGKVIDVPPTERQRIELSQKQEAEAEKYYNSLSPDERQRIVAAGDEQFRKENPETDINSDDPLAKSLRHGYHIMQCIQELSKQKVLQ